MKCSKCGRNKSVAFLNKKAVCKLCWFIMKSKSNYKLISILKKEGLWLEFVSRFPKVVGVNNKVNIGEMDKAMRQFI